MVKFLPLCLAFSLGNFLTAQTSPSQFLLKKFSSDTIKFIITDVTQELGKSHPGFYRYNTQKEFTEYIDSVKLTLIDSLTEVEAFRKLKPIISKIGCLHTDLSFGKESKEYLNQHASLFPFQVYFKDNRAYIKKNFSKNQSIKAGAELISINGRKIDEILNLILPAIPSDGYNLSMKYLALYYQFPGWYRSMIEITEDFSLVIKDGDKETTYHVKGARFTEIAESGFLKEPVPAKQLDFRIEENIALLTIHSFAKSDIKRSGQHFRKFIRNTFKEIKNKDIRNLIVDVRDNTGGTDANAAYFTRHFFDKPFRYWDRIEVTHAIAKQIKGVMRIFYKKPFQKDSTWIWQKGNFTKEFDFYKLQKPAKNNYRGETYVLTSGFCMSSCSDVTAILADNKKATIIGEETGGGYQGNNSGMIPTMKVPLFNFGLSVPLQKYLNYVDSSKNIGRGTIPDYPISASIEDLITGYDKTLTFAMTFIKSSSE